METPEQQRARILRDPHTRAEDYDDAVALGYAPESWDGMWKLPADNPITWLTPTMALVREVVCTPRGAASRLRDGRVKFRARTRALPKAAA